MMTSKQWVYYMALIALGVSVITLCGAEEFSIRRWVCHTAGNFICVLAGVFYVYCDCQDNMTIKKWLTYVFVVFVGTVISGFCCTHSLSFKHLLVHCVGNVICSLAGIYVASNWKK